MLRMTLILFLTGCAGEIRPHLNDGPEESIEGSDTNQDTGLHTDADGDGFTVEDGDCDDEDAKVYPGAEETWYDDKVQNCDLFELDHPFPEGYEWLLSYDKDGDGDVYAVHDRPEGIYLDPDDEDPSVGHEDGHNTGNADHYWENQDQDTG